MFFDASYFFLARYFWYDATAAAAVAVAVDENRYKLNIFGC